MKNLRAKKMLALFNKGFSMSEIGLIWGISKAAVSLYLKYHNVTINKRKVEIVDHSYRDVEYDCKVCCGGKRKILIDGKLMGECPNCGG